MGRGEGGGKRREKEGKGGKRREKRKRKGKEGKKRKEGNVPPVPQIRTSTLGKIMVRIERWWGERAERSEGML